MRTWNYVGLYRTYNLAGPQQELIKKQIIKLFKICDLPITSNINLKIVNYLDFQLNLTENTYKPCKPNKDPIYVNCLSNNPPTIIDNRCIACGVKHNTVFRSCPYNFCL